MTDTPGMIEDRLFQMQYWVFNQGVAASVYVNSFRDLDIEASNLTFAAFG